MTKPTNLFDFQREALRELLRLTEWRTAAEKACRDKYEAAKLVANRDVTRARKVNATDRERERQSIATAWDEARQSIQEKFVSEQSAADRLRDFASQESRDRATTETDKTQSANSDAIWTADSLYEAAEKQAADQLDVLKRKSIAGGEAIESLWDQAAPALARGKLHREDFAGERAIAVDLDEPLDRMDAAIGQSEENLRRLQNLRTLRLVGFAGYIVWLVIFAAIAAISVLTWSDQSLWIGIGAGFALIGSALAHFMVRSAGLRRCREAGTALASSLALAADSCDALLRKANQDHINQLAEGDRLRSGAKTKAQEKYQPLLAKTAERRKAEIVSVDDRHERDLERLRNWQHDALSKAESHFGPALSQCHARHDAELAQAEDLFDRRKEEARADRESDWNLLAEKWRLGQDHLIDVINRLGAAEKEYFLPWNAPFWQQFPPVEVVPNGIRFGSIDVDLRELPGGVPEDEDLAISLPIKMELPAFLPFPDRCMLVLKARDAGRDKAIEELQNVMLRFLTAIPAGKVRFTIVDPVGLGDNFAAFMHLADFDENLIGARIWTEPAQIEKRLADITAHMENVIQKYLRNQYKSIEEYNAQAGEVAEPFRVLVVANFPANFSLEAARRLVSIVGSGATCGVYTLISIDTKQPLPQGFNVADLEQGAINLVWKDGAFHWKDPDLAKFPLTLEAPPTPDEVVRMMRLVGERGRNANRVEVPFEYVMPKKNSIWEGDSRKSIAVAIGRSGATKQQLFQLGIGTAQHALVAGKTGSGKSTLLHALITNLALQYSPDQVELYLIDFKKGVEFKAYAENRLPHARVIAIESEREFGLSVLQRLDGILRERGDAFRDAGVNDLAGYRALLDRERSAPDEPKRNIVSTKCPRLMLIVDEFQEFFVEDDRVAQETALLLDRLVRQGRAFGLHVLLGSQTLGGAYSLARSTIDQMAVRIALQCSDADAQLILNKDNTAARLLTRPGEAIYNDANGLSEGNDLFQVVWLSDAKREYYLKHVRQMAEDRGDYPPPLVFEGNITADIANNPFLAKLINSRTWQESVRGASAWFGEAIAIKDPTAAVFRSHSGSHLLIIGQNEESALALVTSSLIALAAQHDLSARFLILDGTLEDDANAGYLGRIAGTLPHPIDFVDRINLAEHLGNLGALMSARQKGESADRSPRYVVIHGLHRFRDLRKGDEDFGFGRRGADRVVAPMEHLTNILKDGPAFGLHVLVWCDVLTNLNRSIDRQLLREFGMRILFQMNANDSSTLIDNPVASRLGRNRALFLTDDQTNAEKFRPYGLPSAEWLKNVKAQMLARVPNADRDNTQG